MIFEFFSDTFIDFINMDFIVWPWH